MTTSTQFQASEKEDKETVQFVFFFDLVCFLMQAVQPESSRVQPPVPTPVRADATLPQVEQHSGGDTSADTLMTGGAPVQQVDAKVPEVPPEVTSIGQSQPGRNGAPAEDGPEDGPEYIAVEVSRKAIALKGDSSTTDICTPYALLKHV